MDINPADLPMPERYKLLIGGIVPRPIALVSTVSPEGRANLAPFSFFNGVSSNPMSLLFCPANTPEGGEKDTLRNLLRAPEGRAFFVVNVVSRSIAERMAACAEELPYGESEFDLSGLTPEPARAVPVPRVRESLLAYECRAERIIRLAPGAPSAGNIVVGEVLSVHAGEGLVDDRGRIDPARLDAVGRMAGLTYCTTRERFEIPWGHAAIGG